MPRVKENRTRKRRIEMEVVVDAYDADERALGWYCYLEDKLKFPFRARCKSKREISPLRVGEEVEVVGMAPEKWGLGEMFVRLRWCGAKLAVLMSQLEPLAASLKTQEAVADWHYWVGRGYQF